MTNDQVQALNSVIGGQAAGIDGTLTPYAADSAIALVPDSINYLNKAGSAGAYSVAAPGAGMIGKRMTFLTGSDFAHVVTFTGTTLQDGTAGANSTWTATAVQGCALTVMGVTALKWNVVSFNLGTIAP